jgi:adenylate kinase family enzyme
LTEAPSPPLRVAVIGTAGSGKTTFSRQLAARLGVPHIELDALFWLPGWEEPELADFRATVESAVRDDAWVVDGNYSRVRDLVFGRADTVVWLDLPMRTCLWRTTRRTMRRARRSELLWGTNRERWSGLVDRGSLTWWIITTHGRRRRENEERLADPAAAHLRVHRFRSSPQAEAWLASV